MHPQISSEKMQEILNWSYNKSLTGVIGKDVDTVALEYKNKYQDTELAIAHLVHSAELRTSTSGFVTGFGGLITMPLTVPTDITTVIYNQLRMIAVIARLRGYDPHDEEVRTLAYVCLTGMSMADFAKKSGITIGNKIGINMIKKIPGEYLKKINHVVGFRLITKFGKTGAINLGKGVPVIGALIGASVDGISTRQIAKAARKNFLLPSNQ